MKKIISICLFSIILALPCYMLGMQQLSTYIDQGIKKSSAMLHTIPGTLQQLSQSVAVTAGTAYANVKQLAHAAPQQILQTTHNGFVASENILKNILKRTQSLIHAHPKITRSVGATSLGISGIYLLARSRYARQKFNNAKLH